MSDLVWVVLFFGGGGVYLLGLRWWTDRSQRGRGVLGRMYAQRAYPYLWRMTPLVAPVAGVGSIAMALGVLLPRPAGAWVAGGGLLCVMVGGLCMYRVPQPLMPRWLREAIQKGEIPLAHPDGLDWMYFWLIATVTVLGAIGLPVLVLVYHEAG